MGGRGLPLGKNKDTERSSTKVPRIAILARGVDPVVVIGIVISVTISVVLLLTKVANGAESFIIALLGTSITLIINLTARSERQFALIKLVNSVEWLPSVFVSIAESTREVVQSFPREEAIREVRSAYERLEEELSELCRGRVRRPRGDYEYLFHGAETCRNEIRAVTNVLPHAAGNPGWWQSEIGRSYWRLNAEALARGVKIRRIFICDQVDRALAAVIGAQRKAGVDVGVVKRAGIDPSFHLNFAIWDDSSAWEARMNAHGEIIENLFYVSKNEVDRLVRTFKTCQMAREHSSE